jgi:hypothetical protein
MKQDKSSERPSRAAGASRKKPYIKPAFEFERAFETMALACGKINTTQAQCKFNRKNS